ncbi:MAG: DNRLRE domain-containing protein [Ruminococcaceae bacterium]|nr:DNRLRE domain-containing protein [Oscillospiraceae bacterium]
MKTTTTRLLSVLLCLAMIFVTIPHSILAQISETLNDTTDAEATETVAQDVYVLGEVIDNRTETSKTFRMSDGSFIAADYGQVIHYAGEDGTWTDYDNTLTFSEASARDVDDMAGYGNTGSDLRIKLANNSNSNNLVKLTMGNYKISLHLVGADKSKALEVYPAMEDPEGNDIDSAATLHKFSSGAIYEDILPDVDLEYIISGGTVKENIIIKDTADSYTYTFELKLQGLIPEVDSDGNILLKDETTNITQLVIPAGYMYDADGAYSDAVTYSIAHKNGKKYTLTVTADADWINADDRAFPVTVDPTLDKGSYLTSEVDDGYVYEGNPTGSTGSHQFVLGGYSSDSSLRRMRAFFKLNSLPAIPKSAVIVNATLNLHQLGTGNGWKDYSGSASEIIFAARKVTSSWTESTLTWSTQPSVDPIVLDYNVITAATAGSNFKWDITSAAQEWYNGADNNGIALYPITEYTGTGTYGKAGFYSVENPNAYSSISPMFTISYRDTKGLESIWTYASHSAGVAGAGYVNGFNGNLVFVHSDMATEGSIIPVAVSHVYNSFLACKDFTAVDGDINAPITSSIGYTMGKGWKLSIQETLVPYELENSDKEWYVYNDADGTELYFYRVASDSNQYVSEDGYGLIVTVNDNGTITLADEYGNTKLFNADGLLSTITDVYGNQKQINYSNSLPSSVLYRPVGETSNIVQLTIYFNAYGALSSIVNSYNTADYVEYEYSTTYNGSYSKTNSGYLRRITYSLGGYTLFNYNEDGTLASVVNGDTNYKVSYSYADYLGQQRVAAVTESVGGSTGQKVSFAYDNKKFTVRTAGRDDVLDSEDVSSSDDILTTVLFDNFGKAVCSYSSDANSATLYGTSYAEYTSFSLGSKKNNTVTVDSVKGITNENLVTNGNAESLTGWTNNSSGTGYTATSQSVSFMGSKSFKLASTSGGSGSARLTSTVTIPTSGTYTLSAYVKAESLTASSGGAYVSLAGTASERVKTVTNTTVQDGWRRISVTKTLSAGSSIIELVLEGAVGTVYFDCIHLEKSDTPSDYNLIQNGSIRSASNWSGTFATIPSEIERGHVGIIAGTPTAQKRVTQTIPVNAPLNTTFMLSGWAKANSVDLVPDDEETEPNAKSNRKFGMMATLTYSDGTTEEHYVSFNPDITDWQYAALAIVPEKEGENLTIASITVAAVYDYNANTMYFDDLCLTVEPAQTYRYDENGNLTTATDAEGNSSLMTYVDGVDPQTYTTPTGDNYTYTYHNVGSVNTHDVKTVARIVNDTVTQTLTYTYDAYGNALSSTLTAADTTETFSSTATYIEYGNYLETVKDSLNNTTTYSYDSVTKLLKFIEDANSNRTAYTYNDRQQIETIYLDADEDGVLDTTEASVEYLYAQNRLSGITTAKTAYTLTYDVFGNLLSIKAGDNTLATYEYTAGNGKLTKLAYGNGDYEQYTYDHLDRLVKVVYNGNASSGYELFYDANGRLYKTVDYQAGLTHLYEYDSLNRLIFAWQKNSSGDIVLEVQNAYDELGRAKGSTYVIGDTTQTYGITYEDITGLVKTYTTPQNSFTYTYDAFDRLSNKSGSRHAIAYTYVAGTQRVATYNVSQADATNITYSYTYDALGNITSVKKNGTAISNYEYDKLGRLIREDDCTNSISWVYTYDNAGNLQQKYTFYGMTGVPASQLLSIHPYNGSEISSTYTYGSSAWGDLLTGYNGTEIEYDAIGNPLNWHNAASMLWDERKLTYFSEDALDHGIAFAYNSDGIRTKKTLYDYDGSTITHNYILDGSTILKETITSGSGTSTLYYYYDESGISGLEYNGTKYAYVKNLQGDVIRIIDSYGATVVEYKYDAWGNILSTTGSMASTLGATNPFRYRGYYYDTESGWYYLNSRYYDPQVGRFLNADTYVSTGQGLSGYNMFAYCNDNPIMNFDASGCNPHMIFGPQQKISAPAEAPEDIMNEIRRSGVSATTYHYSGSRMEGNYQVHVFSSPIVKKKKWFLFSWTASVWTVAEYFFELVDCEEKFKHHEKQFMKYSKLAYYMSYSDAGDFGHPTINLFMTVVGVLSPIVHKLREEENYRMQIYEGEKGYKYELVFVEIHRFENGHETHTPERIYV